ncbi:alpha/beta fold hydrolase [Streptomyces liangshanensis]|uniref:alpha/beta fold hydrolase n=1 Tax=Streptomyces liangshanensis TaxID=2717324 RepID=UPI0036DD5873
MTDPTTGTLRVDGATLRYEVRGHGPLLLLIPGGTGGAASLAEVADDLAAAYTVATYDPRGMGGSALDDPEAEQSVAEHAEDAFRLLELLSPGEPARVFGASSGGIAALHLLATHPGRVLRAVVHEPPVVMVLPDAAEHRRLLARVDESFRAEGLMPAMAVFAAGLRLRGAEDAPQPQPELPPQAAARTEQTLAGLPYFVGRIVPAFMSYVPDLARLEALSDQLVLAAGQDSPGELTHRPAAHLATRFGKELALFPGGHIGLTTHSEQFTEHLHQTLRT